MANDNDRQTLDRLIEELDLQGRQRQVGTQAGDPRASQRRHHRYAFRADCVIRFLSVGGSQVLATTGRTRNLSRGGLGILVKHVFNMREPVEVELQVPGQPKMFMAGLVQFVRYAGRGYHELGIALHGASPTPVFSHDPETASQNLSWLRESLHPCQF